VVINVHNDNNIHNNNRHILKCLTAMAVLSGRRAEEKWQLLLPRRLTSIYRRWYKAACGRCVGNLCLCENISWSVSILPVLVIVQRSPL